MEPRGQSGSNSDRVGVWFDVVDARSDDALTSMRSYFDELDGRFPEGFDPGDTLTKDAASFDAPFGAFVLARNNERAVGCGGVHRLESDLEGGAGDPIGEIKRMWIAPDWRGRGIGKALLSELEVQGERLGYRTIRLDTHDVLVEAIAMYERAGYVPIDRYNNNPFAKHWFEKSL